MPLKPGKSNAAFEHNVKKLVDEGRPQKQALAIALAQKGEDRKRESRRLPSAHGRPRSR